MTNLEQTKVYNYEKERKKLVEKMQDEYGYIFCQHCKKSRAYKFEVHHIIYRSEASGHINLHHPSNLIILCSDCHNGSGDSFHNRKEKRDYLVEKRNLREIFKTINFK